MPRRAVAEWAGFYRALSAQPLRATPRWQHPTFLNYGFALVAVAGAALLTVWTIPDYNTHFFELFQAAVVLTAWLGGVGPGLLAATSSFLVIDYFFIPPINAFVLGPTDFLRLVIFEAVAMLTSLLSGKLKRANAELVRTHEQLEVRIAQRTSELSHANRQLTREIDLRMEAERAIMEISNREQRRLGQDLHDGLSQTLAGLKLMTERVKQELTKKSRPESKKVAMIESRLGEALAFVETVSRGLYPVELETSGLMAALEELVRNTGTIHHVDCRFTCRNPVELEDSATANHLYRIAQEAVVNAIKGGKAGRIHVRLRIRSRRVILSIADNGIGLRNAPMRKGMGLTMMEDRAKVIDARLVIRSGRSGGTCVQCLLPIRPGTSQAS